MTPKGTDRGGGARRTGRAFLWLAAALAAALAWGPTACRRPAAPGAARGQPAAIEPQAYWEATYMGGAKVGHGVTRTSLDQRDGRRLVRTESETVTRLRRFGQNLTQRMRLISWETPQGELVACQTEVDDGGAVTRTSGRVGDGTLKLQTSARGRSFTASIPWRAEWGGFFAVEQSLRRRPMAAGQRRELHALTPVLNRVGRTTLEAVGLAATKMPDGSSPELLEVRSTTSVGGAVIRAVLWCDAAGEVLKSALPSLNQTTYRVSKEAALAEDGSEGYDLGLATVVRVARRLDHPHSLRRIRYRAVLSEGNPADVFIEDTRQRVTRESERSAVVEVLSSEAAAALPARGPDAAGPQPGDLAPNPLIQSDDPRVAALAAQAAPGEPDPWRIALALEQHVRRSMRSVNYSQAFASAAEVAETLEGDCTEHAVLLAALCRARKIPARVAVGLVYYPPAEGFAYHMWTEAWAGGRWRPLDGTLGRGGIGPAHLKFGHSNLDGVDAYAVLLPVFQVLGQLKLEILEAD